MKKTDTHSSGSNTKEDSDDNDSDDESPDIDDDGKTRNKTDESEERSTSQSSRTPHVTDGSSRYDEETTTDFTSSSKMGLTNITVMSYSTTSSIMSSYTPIRDMMSTPPPSSGSSGPQHTTQRLVWLVTFSSFLIAIVLLFLIICFLWKMFRSRNRVQLSGDIEVKVKGLKDGKVKSDVKGQTVEALNYYNNPDKHRDSIPKDNETELTMRPSVVDQYEEVKDHQISMTNKSSKISFEKDGPSQEYEKTSENVNPIYHVLEPETQIGLNDAMTSHQNTGYDKLHRNGVHDNKIDHGTASGMTYDHVNPTSREEAYDVLIRQLATAPRGVSSNDVIDGSEYSHMNRSMSSDFASYDKLNEKSRYQLNDIAIAIPANYHVLKFS